jgi:hypothetical protein
MGFLTKKVRAIIFISADHLSSIHSQYDQMYVTHYRTMLHTFEFPAVQMQE